MKFCLRRTGTKYVRISLLLLVLTHYVWCCAFDSYRNISGHKSINANDHTHTHTHTQYKNSGLHVLIFYHINKLRRMKWQSS